VKLFVNDLKLKFKLSDSEADDDLWNRKLLNFQKFIQNSMILPLLVILNGKMLSLGTYLLDICMSRLPS
jgi:hypothetical protein